MELGNFVVGGGKYFFLGRNVHQVLNPAPRDTSETLSGFRARRARETPVRGGQGCNDTSHFYFFPLLPLLPLFLVVFKNFRAFGGGWAIQCPSENMDLQ